MLKKMLSFFKSRGFLISLGIAVVGIFLLLWIIFGWLGMYTRNGETVDVPNFVNQKTASLAAFIEDKPVTFEIVDSLWDPKKPKGTVIRQDPEPGSQVKEGRKIYLYVTATVPPKIGMPQLENLSLRQAQYVCESYGLKMKYKMVNNSCNGCVVEQRYKGKRIETNSPIEKGSEVELYIGKGEEQSSGMKIPNLVGLTFRAARGKLMDMNLEWMVIADDGVKDTLNAYIYEQTPAPDGDRQIVPGTIIDLRVSATKAADPAEEKDPE